MTLDLVLVMLHNAAINILLSGVVGCHDITLLGPNYLGRWGLIRRSQVKSSPFQVLTYT